MKPTFGVEEEVFAVLPYRPTLHSLYYLSKFLWKNPLANYFHSAANFSLPSEMPGGFMAGIEISTAIHTNIDALIEDLYLKRKLLADSCEGLLLATGSLITDCSRSRTCALQVHIGGVKNMQEVYARLVFYLPLLTLLTVNTPFAAGKYFGQSFRMQNSFAIGPLVSDWQYRFQDIIYSRRLRTIEIRVFDSIWDIERIRLLLNLIRQIVISKENLPLDKGAYNKLRGRVFTIGYDNYLSHLYEKLKTIAGVSQDIFKGTCSNQVRALYSQHGLLGTYTALDNAYRYGKIVPGSYSFQKRFHFLKIIAGFLGYYIPKLPFSIYKSVRENLN